MKITVTTSPGLENLLKEEIKEMGIQSPVFEAPGAVFFETESWNEIYTVLLKSRIGSRVLLGLKKFSSKNAAMLYDQVRRVDWTKVIPRDLTFAVFCHGSFPTTSDDLKPAILPLKIKDAICDEYRKLANDYRPNVDRQDPDVRIEAFFDHSTCELSVDLAGIPLHRRGYREDGAISPLRENKAAALLRFAGYKGDRSLLDPFCGSGTICFEAYLIARNIFPGVLRHPDDFALTKIFPEKIEEFQAAQSAVQKESRALPENIQISGWDVSATTLLSARKNLRALKLGSEINFEEKNALELEGSGHFIVFNPPYGERVSSQEASQQTLKEFGNVLKFKCPDTVASMIVPKGTLERALGFKASQKLPLENGPFSSLFLRYEIWAAKKAST